MRIDKIFQENLSLIMAQPWETVGRPKYNDGEGVKVKRILQVCNQYDLRREFPISTIRPLNLRGCIKEILWIMQKRSVDTKVLGLHIWDQWTDKDGMIKGCYGDMVNRPVIMQKNPDDDFLGITVPEATPAALSKYSSDEFENNIVGYGFMNQVDFVLWSLKNDKTSRRIIISMFDPLTNSVKPLQECAFQINLSVKGDELYMTLYQRSLDIVTAMFWNVAQYAALMMMFAHDAGLKPAVFTHFVQDMHLYDRHEMVANELLVRPIKGPVPQVSISTRMEKLGFYDFRPEDFEVWNYEPQPQVKFEVAK